MATFSPINNRPLCKKIYVRYALMVMEDQGFPHEWAETYVHRLGDEIDAAASDEDLISIRDRVFALRKSPPPVGWIGA